MKRLFILFGLALLSFNLLIGQTIGQFSMWNQNHYIVNPAAAGNLDYLDVAIGFRRQWAGIKEAPRTFYATGHTVLNRPKSFEQSAMRGSIGAKTTNDVDEKRTQLKHAIGGSMSSNELGAFKKNEISLTYAFHLPLFKEVYLSFGLTGGLNNYGFNHSKAIVIQDNDPVYNAYQNGENSNKLNINSGAYIYSDKFFFGYSANQILQNNLEFSNIKVSTGVNSIAVHHFLIAGYNFDLSNDFRLTPNFIAKSIKNNPLSVDLNATLTYQEVLYFGLTYRTTDAISLMAGFQFNDFVRAGYSYDYTLSDLKVQSSGSHEVFIGLTLF